MRSDHHERSAAVCKSHLHVDLASTLTRRRISLAQEQSVSPSVYDKYTNRGLAFAFDADVGPRPCNLDCPAMDRRISNPDSCWTSALTLDSYKHRPREIGPRLTWHAPLPCTNPLCHNNDVVSSQPDAHMADHFKDITNTVHNNINRGDDT